MIDHNKDSLIEKETKPKHVPKTLDLD